MFGFYESINLVISNKISELVVYSTGYVTAAYKLHANKFWAKISSILKNHGGE